MVFHFGGNHSSSGVKLRQIGPIAFDSNLTSFQSSALASSRDWRNAKCSGNRGVTFRLECQGMQ